jgi:hypothetical protein
MAYIVLGTGVGPSCSGPSEKAAWDFEANTEDKDEAAAAADEIDEAAEMID